MTASRPNNQLSLDLPHSGRHEDTPFMHRRRGEASAGVQQGVEAATAEANPEAPASDQLGESRLMELICQTENIEAAVRRVMSNKGAPGIDRMSTRELPEYLRLHWPRVHEQLLAGEYQPQAVRSVAIDKPGGGTRMLGIPTVLDRVIQQAIQQVLSRQWDPGFHPNSFGFRPGRSAVEAVECAQRYVEEGYDWVVDIDLEQFFDRVNHDVLMSRVARRITDKRVLKLIRAFLTAGTMIDGVASARTVGTPQGGPLSPLLSNLLLDELDRELDRRGLRFVRYADDCNIHVQSGRSAERVMNSIEQWLTKVLRLRVNRAKSAAAPVEEREFLGFGLRRTRNGWRRGIGSTALARMRQRVRELSKRHRGRSVPRIIAELTGYLRGWRGYFRHTQLSAQLVELDRWIRRRLRAVIWHQWKTSRQRYRSLRALGARASTAYRLMRLGNRPWHVSGEHGLYHALNPAYFDQLGLLRLAS
jgi:RNA-directed DNA polymerase